MFRTKLIACALLTASFSPFALAQQPTAEPPAAGPAAEAAGETAATAEAEEAAAFAKAREQFEGSINHRTGTIEIAKGAITLNVPAGFYYLDKADSKTVLVDVWGNPPGSVVEGMLFKEGMSAIDPDSWGVVLTYDESGYVSDEDAAKINYDDLLRDMQSGEKEMNAERARQNFPSVRLVGWAATPHYDARAHKVYWAEDLVFGDDPLHTLNYDMRVLGRKGVLELRFVAAMDQLATVEASSRDVLAIPEFKQGFRYEDYNPQTDKKADYGLAGLVAGGAAGGLLLAKKTGLLALALVFLKKFGIILVAGLGTAGAAVARFFGVKPKPKPAAAGAERSASSLDAQLFPDPPASEPPQPPPGGSGPGPGSGPTA